MIAINMNPAIELITFQFKGLTTANDLILVMNYCGSSYAWKNSYNYFFDIRKMVVGFSIGDFPTLIHNIHKLEPKENTKHACLVELHTHHAVTLTWKNVASMHGIEYKSSFSCQELSEWLDTSVSEITATLEAEPLVTFSTGKHELQLEY